MRHSTPHPVFGFFIRQKDVEFVVNHSPLSAAVTVIVTVFRFRLAAFLHLFPGTVHGSVDESRVVRVLKELSMSNVQSLGRTDHREGYVAQAIEEQTARLPSDVFLWAAGGSIVGSVMLKMAGRHHDSLFVGQWAPTFLILGLYNKLVKIAGSD
ncbi:MAG: hypothetical protein AB7O38_30650 [Pirellulaceae bacterium]